MQAIVLSRRNFRESDQIVSLYTLEKGKVDLLARGIKKITSKNAAHLEPFSLVDIDIAQGKEIDHLTKVHPINYFSNIRNDLTKSLISSYAVYFLNRMIEVGEEDKQLFSITQNWLEFINQSDDCKNILLDSYIASILPCLGLVPETQACVLCGAQETPHFYFAGGGVLCSNCAEEKKKISETIVDFDSNLKDYLKAVMSGDWEFVNSLELKESEVDIIHDFLYKFVLFHSEKNIEDWKIKNTQ